MDGTEVRVCVGVLFGAPVSIGAAEGPHATQAMTANKAVKAMRREVRLKDIWVIMIVFTSYHYLYPSSHSMLCYP
jgi:hypothetical protein